MSICSNKTNILLPFYLNKKIIAALPDKGEIKADRELEIKLNRGTLMVPADGILDLNVDLQKKKYTQMR